MLKTIQNKILGLKRYQGFFEKLYHISKFGRNIGLPIDVNSSGEINFIYHIEKNYKKNNEFIFFDIGANHGIYTDNVLKIVAGNKHCYLFEPQNGLYQQLNEKYTNNKNISIINKGCGNAYDKLMLYSFEGTDTLASLYNNFKGTIQPASAEEIEIIRLEDFFRDHSIGFVDLIKIDVEGHELKVILGMSQYIKERKIGIIQFEFGSFNVASRTFFKDFWELLHLDYDMYRIVKDGLVEIKNYTPDLEIFDTTNYTAMLKKSLN